jgi:hypothetical protein
MKSVKKLTSWDGGRMLILKLVAALMFGLAGHRTWGPTRQFGDKLGNLVRYAIGILLFIPSQILIKTSLPKHADHPSDEMERDLVAGLLAAGALGTGVMLGHVFDGRRGDDE